MAGMIAIIVALIVAALVCFLLEMITPTFGVLAAIRLSPAVIRLGQSAPATTPVARTPRPCSTQPTSGLTTLAQPISAASHNDSSLNRPLPAPMLLGASSLDVLEIVAVGTRVRSNASAGRSAGFANIAAALRLTLPLGLFSC